MFWVKIQMILRIIPRQLLLAGLWTKVHGRSFLTWNFKHANIFFTISKYVYNIILYISSV